MATYRIKENYRLGQAARGIGNVSFDVIKVTPSGFMTTLSRHRTFLNAQNKLKIIKKQKQGGK